MDLVNRYIKVTRENEKEVLRALEELGFTWCDGDKLSEFSTFNGYSSKYSDTHFIQIISENKVNFCTKEIFLDAYIKNKEFNLAYLKSFCKDNIPDGKLEFTKIIRKLKDLDGLENGSGLKISVYGHPLMIKIHIPFEDNIVFNKLVQDCGIQTIHQLKAMGFEFEYKPLRTEQEVKNEILKLESLPFIHEKANYYVGYNSLINKYLVICDSVNGHGLHIYMTEEQAQKYADELNEIIGGK